MSRSGAITSWRNAAVLSTSQFGADALGELFEVAGDMEVIVEGQGGCDLLKHRVLANVFYEPSTRTSCSFATAMMRLGGTVLQVNESTSSAVKGESLADTMRSLACYADAVVLRHPVAGSAAEAAAAISLPFLNAGDGTGEHPTQALLDLYTIGRELGAITGMTITMVGDLKNGRTVHSLVRLLLNFDVTFHFVAPEELGLPAYLVEEVKTAGKAAAYHTTLDAALPASDVLYVTRVQKERFSSPEEYERLKHVYVITPEVMARAKPKMAVMHPLPRVGEIDPAVDADPRAAYFRQMRYGLFVRMALLALVMGVEADDVVHQAATVIAAADKKAASSATACAATATAGAAVADNSATAAAAPAAAVAAAPRFASASDEAMKLAKSLKTLGAYDGLYGGAF